MDIKEADVIKMYMETGDDYYLNLIENFDKKKKKINKKDTCLIEFLIFLIVLTSVLVLTLINVFIF